MIARFQLFAMLAILAALGAGAFILWRWIESKGGLGEALKASPLGVPSRAIDAGISYATNRDETLGGWLAEILDPSTRAARKMLETPPAPKPASPYSINPRDRT